MNEVLSIQVVIREFERIFEFLFLQDIFEYTTQIERNTFHKNEYSSFTSKFPTTVTKLVYTSHQNKSIEIRPSISKHPKCNILFTCSVMFKNNNEGKEYSRDFSIKDYTTFRNIPFNEIDLCWKMVDNYEEGIVVAKTFFEYLKTIINSEEIQKILFTDYWIMVPIDYSPYK